MPEIEKIFKCHIPTNCMRDLTRMFEDFCEEGGVTDIQVYAEDVPRVILRHREDLNI
jgi:hypothetical protein